MWETPVPIPNTMVKTQAADGTALETVWESRWPPDQKRKRQIRCKCSGDSYRYRQKMSNNLSPPTRSAGKCCYDKLVLPVIRVLKACKRFRVLMTDEAKAKLVRYVP